MSKATHLIKHKLQSPSTNDWWRALILFCESKKTIQL